MICLFLDDLFDFCSTAAPTTTTATASAPGTDSGVDLLGGFTSDEPTDKTPTVEKQNSTPAFDPFETITDGKIIECTVVSIVNAQCVKPSNLAL